jgi:hypothetical protein
MPTMKQLQLFGVIYLLLLNYFWDYQLQSNYFMISSGSEIVLHEAYVSQVMLLNINIM